MAEHLNKQILDHFPPPKRVSVDLDENGEIIIRIYINRIFLVNCIQYKISLSQSRRMKFRFTNLCSVTRFSSAIIETL